MGPFGHVESNRIAYIVETITSGLNLGGFDFREFTRSSQAFIGNPWAKPSSQNAHVHSVPHRLARHPALRMRVRSGYKLASPLHEHDAAPALADRDHKPGNVPRTREHVPVRSRPGAR